MLLDQVLRPGSKFRVLVEALNSFFEFKHLFQALTQDPHYASVYVLGQRLQFRITI